MPPRHARRPVVFTTGRRLGVRRPKRARRGEQADAQQRFADLLSSQGRPGTPAATAPGPRGPARFGASCGRCRTTRPPGRQPCVTCPADRWEAASPSGNSCRPDCRPHQDSPAARVEVGGPATERGRRFSQSPARRRRSGTTATSSSYPAYRRRCSRPSPPGPGRCRSPPYVLPPARRAARGGIPSAAPRHRPGRFVFRRTRASARDEHGLRDVPGHDLRLVDHLGDVVVHR
jgi:hypothetical protein